MLSLYWLRIADKRQALGDWMTRNDVRRPAVSALESLGRMNRPRKVLCLCVALYYTEMSRAPGHGSVSYLTSPGRLGSSTTTLGTSGKQACVTRDYLSVGTPSPVKKGSSMKQGKTCSPLWHIHDASGFRQGKKRIAQGES